MKNLQQLVPPDGSLLFRSRLDPPPRSYRAANSIYRYRSSTCLRCIWLYSACAVRLPRLSRSPPVRRCLCSPIHLFAVAREPRGSLFSVTPSDPRSRPAQRGLCRARRYTYIVSVFGDKRTGAGSLAEALCISLYLEDGMGFVPFDWGLPVPRTVARCTREALKN